ncbi:unnamed protein product, partial [Meganyctiphanes norvegica]
SASGYKRRQLERMSRLQNHCRRIADKDHKTHSPSLDDVASTLVNGFQILSQYSVLSCYVNKAGSSAWNALLAHLYNLTEYLQPQHFYMMQNELRPTEIQLRVAALTPSWIRFLMVRDPLSRLLSAYRDRIADNSHYTFQAAHYGPLILHYTRPEKRYQDDEIFYTNNTLRIIPTFQEFVRFLVQDPVEKMDPHWKPIYSHCGACTVHFTHVVHMETFTEDLVEITRECGMDSDIVSKVLQDSSYKHESKQKTSLLMTSYYATLSTELLQELLRIYNKDFILFGYDPTTFLSNLQPNITIDLDLT